MRIELSIPQDFLDLLSATEGIFFGDILSRQVNAVCTDSRECLLYLIEKHYKVIGRGHFYTVFTLALIIRRIGEPYMKKIYVGLLLHVFNAKVHKYLTRGGI